MGYFKEFKANRLTLAASAIGLAKAPGAAVLSIALERAVRFDTFVIVCAVATAAGTAAFVATRRIREIASAHEAMI